MRTYISIIFLALSFCSCQKIIDVNLNDSDTKYVVAGNITNEGGPYKVTISTSVNVDQDNTFPASENAIVSILDITSGLIDTLEHVSSGTYQTKSLIGIPGHTYNLTVNIGQQTFIAVSTMPQPVELDSIYTKDAVFGDDKDIIAVYKDPARVGNYYHLNLIVRDSVSDNIYLRSDDNDNGKEVSQMLRNNRKMHTNDSIKVELACIDENVFNYYQNLRQTISQNSVTPSNPQSNISGGALGYFSAHTVSKKAITLK